MLTFSFPELRELRSFWSAISLRASSLIWVTTCFPVRACVDTVQSVLGDLAVYVMNQPPGLIPFTSTKASEYARIKTVAGVCLVAKNISGERQGLCTGTVVSFREGIVLVTSERIIPSKELDKVKKNSEEWNKGDYVLYFKSGKNDELKKFFLNEVTEPNGVNCDQGLVTIRLNLDSKKLSDNFKNYRPFKANDNKITDPEPFMGSICRIVKGNARSFEVESYEIEYDGNGKQVLRARSAPRSTFNNVSELTANGTVSDRLAFGGGIFKEDVFVGVLTFDDDDPGQIVTVQCWSGKLVGKYSGIFSRGSS